jgi:hypothetical protein
MRTKKDRPIISADDVAVVFNDEQVAELAKTAKLPPGTDMAALAEGVQEAARIFAREASLLTGNELHSEIAGLHKAADRYWYDVLAAMMENLSSQARNMLKERGPAGLEIELPPPDALRDPARRDGACETIARFCRVGGGYIDGRRRPSGKQSRPTWRQLLHAPEPRRNFAKRDAERNFVLWLSIAWLDATGVPPSRTAHHKADGRDVGPFARFLRRCLRLVGAGDADAVELMNELHRRRREGESPDKNAVS